ncbi:hypothetical protein PsYK624_062520 [Phanerochaete sordida]|uniref:Uncharacterized protein n=1 Tax=Phanerochaete sordida TaxID=48140 RepID=A0A9P3G896_9APHY|nr:hypothetical protein PsYK624_062520 [Phanerochaete sordida]
MFPLQDVSSTLEKTALYQVGTTCCSYDCSLTLSNPDVHRSIWLGDDPHARLSYVSDVAAHLCAVSTHPKSAIEERG